MRNQNPIFYTILLLSALMLSVGCSSKKTETAPATEAPAASETEALPSVSFDGEEVIEPMFPTEETPEEILSTVRLMKPEIKIAQEAGAVKLPKADDLAPQIAVYVEKLEKTLDDLDGSVRFAEDADVLYRDANTLALIALALGLSKEDNPYKKAAPAIIEAAMKMETVKNLDEATKAVAEVKKSLKANGNPADLSWEQKVASLKPIMKAVPNINTLVKRNIRTEAAMKKGPRKVVEGAAIMAVIGQGSIPNAAETIKPNAAKEWKQHCIEFRDAAWDLNRLASEYEAGKTDFDNVQIAFEALTDTCDSCHKLFYHGDVSVE